MSKNLVWEIKIAKKGKKKPFKTIHVSAEFFLEAAHVAHELVYGGEDEEGMFEFRVNIIGINRVEGIKDLVNNHPSNDNQMHRYDPEMPYRMLDNKTFPADEVIKFKCDCKNDVIVANFNWPYIHCKSCNRRIFHRDLEFSSGLWLYHPSN